MNRRWAIRITLFSFGHYVSLLLLNSLIYLQIHIPTPVVKLDTVIVLLTYLYQILTGPRWLLRELWWGEATPTLLNWTLAIANSLLWGLLLTYLTRNRWRHSWENAV